jgi:uncharacterized protein (DUF885 family)
MKYLILALPILLAACGGAGSKGGAKMYTKEQIAAESKKVNDFLDKKFDEATLRDPEMASSMGFKEGYGEWSNRTDEWSDKELKLAKDVLDSLDHAFNLDALDEQTQLSVRMYREDIDRWEEGMKWRHYGYWVTQMGGVHTDLPAFLINVHRVDSIQDAEAYLSRLDKMDRVFNEVLVGLKKSEEVGSIPPHFTFPKVTADIKDIIAGLDKKDDSNILYTDFSSKVDALQIDAAKKVELKAQAAQILSTKVKGAYQSLLDYWTALEPKAAAKGDNGVWDLPKGDAFYAHNLQYHTTTKMTPDEVFELGEKEVARIQGEMRILMKQVNFKSDSLQEFFDFVRSDKQFKYSNDEKGRKELLDESNKYIGDMKKKLPELFNTLPKADVVVKQVEKFREKSAGGAFYEDPALDGSRPGRFYVNTYNMNDEPKYQMEALCYHEAIPGHHMQIAIAQELKNIPKFRRHEFFTSYIEGWALYAESLGKEVGMYQDPYSDFGRLSMEIFRAARLVVDVGIHYKKWTREQAVDYFMKNTANAKGDIENEIERYFIWPGQATGYKVGMLKIMQLREHAKQELGAKFDIRKFHDVVICNGAVSLTTLEELVNKWIEKEKKAKS